MPKMHILLQQVQTLQLFVGSSELRRRCRLDRLVKRGFPVIARKSDGLGSAKRDCLSVSSSIPLRIDSYSLISSSILHFFGSDVTFRGCFVWFKDMGYGDPCKGYVLLFLYGIVLVDFRVLSGRSSDGPGSRMGGDGGVSVSIPVAPD